MAKVKLFKYNKNFINLFKKERSEISKLIRNCEIHHVGSTAVPGLGGKGIIDMTVALKNWRQKGEAIKKLKEIGFVHIRPKGREYIFISKKYPTGYKDIHIHLVKGGNKKDREMLFFRDCLRKDKKEAERYLD